MDDSSSVLADAFKFGRVHKNDDWEGDLSPDPLDRVLDCEEEDDPNLALLVDAKEDFQ